MQNGIHLLTFGCGCKCVIKWGLTFSIYSDKPVRPQLQISVSCKWEKFHDLSGFLSLFGRWESGHGLCSEVTTVGTMLWHYSYPPSGDHDHLHSIDILDLNNIVVHQTKKNSSNLSLECGSNMNICHEHTLFLLIALLWQIKLHVALQRAWEHCMALKMAWGLEY